MRAKNTRAILTTLALALLLLPAAGCASKLDRGVSWCKQNYSGYTRQDCINQMRRDLDGT